MELEPEKYQSLQELVKIQSEIAVGRAELQRLKETTEEYAKEREAIALKKVQEALHASKDALSEADKNRHTLASFFTEAGEVVRGIAGLHAALKEEQELFNIGTKEILDELDVRIEEANRVTSGLRAKRIQIEDERGSLEVLKRSLDKEARKLSEDRGVLERAKSRIKKK